MAEHFRLATVKAGDWRRYRKPMGSHGRVDDDRPHFVAQTEAAEEFVRLNAELVIQTGLCPGWVKVGDRETLAYRFREVTDDKEALERVLRDLDAEVNRVMVCHGHS
jgi:hypothetical protein